MQSWNLITTFPRWWSSVVNRIATSWTKGNKPRCQTRCTEPNGTANYYILIRRVRHHGGPYGTVNLLNEFKYMGVETWIRWRPSTWKYQAWGFYVLMRDVSLTVTNDTADEAVSYSRSLKSTEMQSRLLFTFPKMKLFPTKIFRNRKETSSRKLLNIKK